MVRIEQLPAPACPHDGTDCQIERVAAVEQRPGETDVTVRCLTCQACCHYVIKEASGVRRQASGEE